MDGAETIDAEPPAALAPPIGEPAASGAFLLACFGADLAEDPAVGTAAAAECASCEASNLAALEAAELPAGGLLFLAVGTPVAEAAPRAEESRTFPNDAFAPTPWFKEEAAEGADTFFLLVLVGSDPM